MRIISLDRPLPRCQHCNPAHEPLPQAHQWMHVVICHIAVGIQCAAPSQEPFNIIAIEPLNILVQPKEPSQGCGLRGLHSAFRPWSVGVQETSLFRNATYLGSESNNNGRPPGACELTEEPTEYTNSFACPRAWNAPFRRFVRLTGAYLNRSLTSSSRPCSTPIFSRQTRHRNIEDGGACFRTSWRGSQSLRRDE